MKHGLVITSIGALVATTGTLAMAAAGPPTITGGVLGSGVLVGQHKSTVQLSHTKGFVMENATVPAGATFGWHLHRTPVVVAITAGVLTLYDSNGPKCTPRRYKAGQGFVEPANHIHMARNEGTTTVTLLATYIGVPPALRANPNNLDVSQKRPGKCPSSVQ